MEKLIFSIPQKVDEFTERGEEPLVLPVLYHSKEKAQADFSALILARVEKAKEFRAVTAPIQAALLELNRAGNFSCEPAKDLRNRLAELSTSYWSTEAFIFGGQYFNYSLFIYEHGTEYFALPKIQTLEEYFTSGLLTSQQLEDMAKKGVRVYS